MKYKCLHCDHVFELDEKDFRRCPSCFWTTSLVEEGAKGADEIQARLGRSSSDKTSIPPFELKKWAAKGVAVLSGTAVVFVILFLFISNRDKIMTALPKTMPIQALSLPRLPAARDQKQSAPRAKPARDVKTVLTAEEWNQLNQTFQLTVPRPLTPDEEDILKKQAPFPLSLTKSPALLMWTKDDFEKFLESEQKKRKIPLGFWYEHSIKKTFREHYLPATAAFNSKDYFRVRDELIRSLTFPVYQNNLERYRAVVLVMLRPFINDVLGKLAVLNQYLANQTLVAQAQAIYQSYQAFGAVLDLHEWEKAGPLIQSLKQDIAAFDAKSARISIPVSPALSLVDPEIRAAVERETVPPEGAEVSLKTLSVDLDLKEKIVRQNRAETLTKVQKQYEDALELLGAQKWEDAREKLRALDYPPELVQEAKNKIALIDKILAAQNANQ